MTNAARITRKDKKIIKKAFVAVGFKGGIKAAQKFERDLKVRADFESRWAFRLLANVLH